MNIPNCAICGSKLEKPHLAKCRQEHDYQCSNYSCLVKYQYCFHYYSNYEWADGWNSAPGCFIDRYAKDTRETCIYVVQGKPYATTKIKLSGIRCPAIVNKIVEKLLLLQ